MGGWGSMGHLEVLGFKLIYSLGEMLERDFIQSDLEAKHLEVPHRPPAAHAAPLPS